VQRAIAVVFTRFAASGSAQRVVRSLCADHALLPPAPAGRIRRWRPALAVPCPGCRPRLLHNPALAGACVYGRCRLAPGRVAHDPLHRVSFCTLGGGPGHPRMSCRQRVSLRPAHARSAAGGPGITGGLGGVRPLWSPDEGSLHTALPSVVLPVPRALVRCTDVPGSRHTVSLLPIVDKDAWAWRLSAVLISFIRGATAAMSGSPQAPRLLRIAEAITCLSWRCRRSTHRVPGRECA